MRLLLAGLLGLALVSTAGAQRSFEEAVLPLPQYRAADARALAEAHAPELRRLYDDVRRCVPELCGERQFTNEVAERGFIHYFS